MRRAWCIALLLCIVAARATAQETSALSTASDRDISLIGPDLYLLRDGARRTVFLASKQGVVVVDPLSLPTAQWLIERLTSIVPGVPVRHVLLTHSHPDRAAGNGAFGRGVSIVAHSDFRRAISESGLPPAQYRFVSFPSVTFERRHTITLGEDAIELVHAGPLHSLDLSVIRFARQRMLFVADPPPLRPGPLSLQRLKTADVVRWFQVITSLEFERIVFSDGSTMTRDEFAPMTDYFTQMRRGVLRAYERGHSLRRVQDDLRLDAFRQSPHYGGRAAQIAEMMRQVSLVRAELTVSGNANYLPENPTAFCGGFETCSAGGAVPAGSVAFSILPGRRFGFQAEVTLSEQFWSTRTRPLYEEETVLRPFSSAFLLRLNVAASRSLVLVGGVTTHYGDVKGMDRVSGQYAPAGGRHPIADNDRRQGFVVGFDLAPRIGPLRLVIPVRFTQVRGEIPDFWPSRYGATAGAGIALPVFRRLR